MIAFVVCASAVAQEPCDATCERTAAEELLRRGKTREAIARLRPAIERLPDAPALDLLLARAYLVDGNLFWAESTLRAAVARRPDDAGVRAWLALAHLRQGDPELAAEVLASIPAAGQDAVSTRHKLLDAYRSLLDGEVAGARSLLHSIGRNTIAFEEDRRAFVVLRRQADPRRVDLIAGETELEPGTTSNAIAGSPADPGGSGAGAGFLDGRVTLRIAPPLTPGTRVVIDLEARGHRSSDATYREFDSIDTRGRLGMMTDLGGYRLLAGWRAERLVLDQTPSRFSEAQRGEFELEGRRGWMLFGGGGRREFRDARRTRDEWDIGGGGPLRIGRATVVAGVTVRGADAESPAYDLRGVSVAAATRIALPRRLTARVAASAAWDDYLHSGGREGLLVFGTEEPRRDVTGKLTLGAWLPQHRGLRAGIEGQLARRSSTADDRPGYDFDYEEARVAIILRFGFGHDRSVPRAVRVPGHVPMPWGLSGVEGSEAEKILELLQQDEELRRGSSCGI